VKPPVPSPLYAGERVRVRGFFFLFIIREDEVE
jgi:hypothetical protein